MIQKHSVRVIEINKDLALPDGKVGACLEFCFWAHISHWSNECTYDWVELRDVDGETSHFKIGELPEILACLKGRHLELRAKLVSIGLLVE